MVKKSTHEILNQYFEKKKKSSAKWTLRGMAKHLEVSPSFLSRVLTGKKPVPYGLLLKFRNALDIEAEVFAGLKLAHTQEVEGERAPVRGRVNVQSQIAPWDLETKSSFGILRQWFYVAILEACSLSQFDGTVDMLARLLDLSPTTTEVAVRELLAKGLLKNGPKGLSKTRKKIRFSSSQSLPEIRRFHEQILEKAKGQLRNATTPEEMARRMITGVTITANPESIQRAKKKLAECLHEIANDLTSETGSEVYQLSGLLFPLTK